MIRTIHDARSTAIGARRDRTGTNCERSLRQNFRHVGQYRLSPCHLPRKATSRNLDVSWAHRPGKARLDYCCCFHKRQEGGERFRDERCLGWQSTLPTGCHQLGSRAIHAGFPRERHRCRVLPELIADDLIGLGVTSIGHRRKLLAAIATLRENLAIAGAPIAMTAAPLPGIGADTGAVPPNDGS